MKVEVKKGKSGYTAYLRQIRIFGYSPIGQEEALKDLNENIDNFFTIHNQRGTLDKALGHLKLKLL